MFRVVRFKSYPLLPFISHSRCGNSGRRRGKVKESPRYSILLARRPNASYNKYWYESRESRQAGIPRDNLPYLFRICKSQGQTQSSWVSPRIGFLVPASGLVQGGAVIWQIHTTFFSRVCQSRKDGLQGIDLNEATALRRGRGGDDRKKILIMKVNRKWKGAVTRGYQYTSYCGFLWLI